jgi:uracil-DNA glycosylase family 4
MFTGDRSGEWLFGALHRFGFANQPNSQRRDDDFALRDCYITATIRCAPPANKPLPGEIENCRPYFLEELSLLGSIEVILTLGQIAFAQTLRSLRLAGYEVPSLEFGHGRIHTISSGDSLRASNSQLRTITLVVTYHPSQQNTQTGKLTRPMFDRIFQIIRKTLGG